MEKINIYQKYYKARADKRKEEGICVDCGKAPAVTTRCQKCVERHRLYATKRAARVTLKNRQLRRDILDRYGKVCQCCGESEYKFLCIDHINGGGNKHRRENKVAGNISYWLKKNNYPKGFQVLCYNCNCAKGFFGECPHQINKTLEVSV